MQKIEPKAGIHLQFSACALLIFSTPWVPPCRQNRGENLGHVGHARRNESVIIGVYFAVQEFENYRAASQLVKLRETERFSKAVKTVASDLEVVFVHDAHRLM